MKRKLLPLRGFQFYLTWSQDDKKDHDQSRKIKKEGPSLKKKKKTEKYESRDLGNSQTHDNEDKTCEVLQSQKSMPTNFLPTGTACICDSFLRIYGLKWCMEKGQKWNSSFVPYWNVMSCSNAPDFYFGPCKSNLSSWGVGKNGSKKDLRAWKENRHT